METSAGTIDVLLMQLFATQKFRYVGDVQTEACKTKFVCHEPYGKS